MLDYEIKADLYDELLNIINEEFVEEANWAFVIEFENIKRKNSD